MSRRGKKPQAVTHRRTAFNDRRDSIVGNFYQAGAAIPSANGSPLPRRSPITRLQRSLASGDPFPWSGYGADQPHVVSFSRTRFPVVGPTVFAGVRLPIAPLQAIRRTQARDRVAFNALKVPYPGRVEFCLRRKQRREVLFAKQVAGFRRSPGRGGSYVRSPFSSWSC